MQQTQTIMGMPVTIEVADSGTKSADLKAAFDYFRHIDAAFSTYKEDSEISRLNQGLAASKLSSEVTEVLELCQQTKKETLGYFDAYHNGTCDPSGLVKGLAILRAAKLLQDRGLRNMRVEAGGDMQLYGHSSHGEPWRIGIRNPFNHRELIKTLTVTNKGVATSGTAVRGQHVYNPHKPNQPINDIMSITVIGPDIYEADRFATAAFAMGKTGIGFLESRPELEGYMVCADQTAIATTGFEEYVA